MALVAPGASSTKSWQFLFNFSNMISAFALILSAISLYYSKFYEHRSILLTVSPISYPAGVVKSQDTFTLSPIISNGGNRTEVIIGVSLAINYPTSTGIRHVLGPPAGPFILKAGDVITVPVGISFDRMLPGTQDINVRVAAPSPKGDMIAVDVRFYRVTITKSPSGEVQYAAHRNPKYDESLVDLYSAPRSHFRYEGPSVVSEAQTKLTIQFGPRPR